MLSRAHLLIQKEYRNFKKDPPWGVDAFPLNHSIFEWGAKIKGLRGTVWEGGIFWLYIKFDENFNLRPPQICFHTIPFHPNVDMITGQPCVDILDNWEEWKECFSIGYVLLTIQSLLSNPGLENPVNTEAADLLKRSPRSYRQMVLDCVSASQMLEAGLTPELGKQSSKVHCVPAPKATTYVRNVTTAPTKVSRLSFEDYHSTWCGIATSKTAPGAKNTFLESIKENQAARNRHMGLTEQEIEEQINRQVEEHNILIYGRFTNKLTEHEEKAAKLEKLNRMKKIYLPPRKPLSSPVPNNSVETVERVFMKEEPWETEVDDLVNWSSKLDTNFVDT
ncbi:ubiquitin-conjugating enzyme E2 U-like [Liolophura sinensis]|uniref:ubiquitin-conjugating enzyme E2 U-like n=1 Tax=Liolophura sinensis TaxID=3198878 RepID=UPI0031587B6E